MVESEKYSDVQVGGGDIGIVPAANDSSSTNVTPAANDSTPVAGFIFINDDPDDLEHENYLYNATFFNPYQNDKLSSANNF